MANNLLDKASIILTPTAYNNGEALCVKPSDGSGDFDFSRNSAATRVNAQGLVENVQILSSNLVQNGDFSEEGAEEVSNGSFSQEGSELVTNGSFDTDTDWSKSGNVTIGEGKANFNIISGSFTRISQNISLVNGKTYKLDLQVTTEDVGKQIFVRDTSSGDLGGLQQLVILEDGVTDYTYYFTANSNSNAIYIKRQTASGDYSFSIDNVSVREVGQDWILGTGWSIGEDKAVGSSTTQNLQQLGILQSNKTYKLTYTILDYVSGSIRPNVGTVNGTLQSSNGTFTEYITSLGSHFYFDAVSSFNGSITNISVKEVGQNWTLGTGWSIGEDKAISDGSGFGALSSSYSNFNSKKLKVNFDILNYVSGEIRVPPSYRQDGLDIRYSANGSYELIYNSINSAFALNTVNFNGSVTNISVIEITDDTNLPRINYEGFSYDGSGNVVPDSGCGSWLWEPQSTNLITQSETFSDSYWSKSNSNVTPNSTISPDGTTNATLMVGTVQSSTGSYIRAITTAATTIGETYTLSLYVKPKGGSKFFKFWARNTDAGIIIFNLVDGTTDSPTTSTITNVGNGWFRVTTTGVLTTSTVAPYFYAYYSATESEGFYIWAAQIEQGNISSYIPTSGSTVTRNQDLCTNGGSLASINSTEGTLYLEASRLNGNLSQSLITISGSGSGFIAISYRADGKIWALAINGGYENLMQFTPPNFYDTLKICYKYKSNDFALWVNGVEVASSTVGELTITDLNKLSFGAGYGGANFFGKTKCLAVWKEALSDSELQSLTTI